MGLRSDSYGTTTGVLAFTRHLLGGQSAFNSTTLPTKTEVETFCDRASGHLNVALAGAGIGTPVTNSTAKLILDDWVVQRAVEYVEATQRGVGFNDQEGNRIYMFRNMFKAATDFVKAYRPGLVELGVTVNDNLSRGVVFTGETAQGERTDKDDSGLEKPLFLRHQFGVDSVSDDWAGGD